MPYHTAFVTDVEKAMFLRKFDVPFWVLNYVFGKDAMHGHRMDKAWEEKASWVER